jgi:hypothetical protein
MHFGGWSLFFFFFFFFSFFYFAFCLLLLVGDGGVEMLLDALAEGRGRELRDVGAG